MVRSIILLFCIAGGLMLALPSCSEMTSTSEDCSNGKDDDSDGLVDCMDADCNGFASCGFINREICDDLADNDSDGVIDCDDADCNSFLNCMGGSMELCNNGVDDDGDGLVDCADVDCNSHSDCSRDSLEICNNFIDDDGDGFLDCLDRDCITFTGCAGCPPNASPIGGGDGYGGRVQLEQYPEVDFPDTLVFLSNSGGEFIYQHYGTSDLSYQPSVFNPETGEYDLPGFVMNSWVIGQGDTLFSVNLSRGSLRLTSCFTIELRYSEVSVGGATHGALEGEAFPIENITIVTTQPFTR